MMIPACRLADLPRGEACRLDTDPPVSVFHAEDGEVFAIDDTCTHQDASLADGMIYVRMSTEAPDLSPCAASRPTRGPA